MHSEHPPRIPTGQKTEMRGQGSGPTASLRAGGERRVREAREVIGVGRNRFERGSVKSLVKNPRNGGDFWGNKLRLYCPLDQATENDVTDYESNRSYDHDTVWVIL